MMQKRAAMTAKEKKQIKTYLQAYIKELDRTDAMYENDFAHLNEKLAAINDKDSKQKQFIIKQNLL